MAVIQYGKWTPINNAKDRECFGPPKYQEDAV